MAPALWGGYSQYMYVHPNAIVHKMPSHIPAAHAAAFLPFSNGVEWAYEYGEVGLGDAILIQGPGQQGLACVIAAKAAGAACIIVSRPEPGRAAHGGRAQLGADYTIDVETEDVVERVMHYTGGDGVNVVGQRHRRRQGHGGARRSRSPRRELQHRPAGRGQRDDGRRQPSGGARSCIKQANGHSYKSVELAIQFIASGKLPMEDISTHTFPMSRAMEAIDAVAGKGAPGAIHVSIMPGM